MLTLFGTRYDQFVTHQFKVYLILGSVSTGIAVSNLCQSHQLLFKGNIAAVICRESSRVESQFRFP